jgi:hypothetical protein
MGLLRRLRTLAPIEVGPWWSARKYVFQKMKEFGVKPGDILCRKGNAYTYAMFPFSEFICYLTGSEYSHAALVVDTSDDDILIADVNTTGLRRQFLVDWCDDVRGNNVSILRYNGNEAVVKLAVENTKTILRLDPSHGEFLDNESDNNFYCVELVIWAYLRSGVLLCEDIPICKLPKWRRGYNFLARLHGVDYNASVWCVGNKDFGLLSSPHLSEVGKIPYSSIRHPKLAKRPGFAGA